MEIKSPNNIAERNPDMPTIFLAGSIEMGTVENWQAILAERYVKIGFTVFNPRRNDWNSEWEQKFTNPEFYQQVDWELTALEAADEIVIYFHPDTKAPISLLELGLFANSKKIKVICPDGFYRKGNVDIVCNKFKIPLYTSIGDFIERNYL